MLINSLKLYNYRNYSRKQIEFSPELNIIIGNNGVGKTNILESIVFVSNTKSFRTNNDQNLIKKGEEFSKIEIDSDQGLFKVVVNKKNKSLFLNNILIKKSSDYIGKINAVLFKPDDLDLFVQIPGERRKVLNMEINKVSNKYIKTLLQYEKLLKDKNRLLKEIEIDETLLNIIDESMVPLIRIILKEREEFFEIINKNISTIYNRISNEKNNISVIYKKCSEIENVDEEIRKTREKDYYYHYASFGPHHDDYYFLMDNQEVSTIASQGQKRMLLIAFKFSLIEYIKTRTNQVPIILLDDILSELDRNNKERLLNIIPEDVQIIITDTDINELNIKRKYKLIEIKEETYV